MGNIIVKGTEKVLVLNTREALLYQSVVPNWKDIRVGAFVSITKTAADDDPTGLAETLATTGVEADRLWLGMKDSTNNLPRSAPFFGVGNSPVTETAGSSVVETIDADLRWRAKYATSSVGCFLNDGTNKFAETTLQPFRTIQAPASLSNNYCTLVLLKMVRSIVGNTVDHFYVAKVTDAAVDYADSGIESLTPTIDAIRSGFRTAVFTEILSGPHTFSSVPDTFFAYWPFSNSRLRIHSLAIEKFS